MSHFLTLTLDEAEGLLYAGAREAVFALSTAALNLQATVGRRNRAGGAASWE